MKHINIMHRLDPGYLTRLMFTRREGYEKTLTALSQMQLQKSQEQYQKPLFHIKKLLNLWWCSIKSKRRHKC